MKIDGDSRITSSQQSLEMTEEAREGKWAHSSFCRELFMGKFNFDRIYPFPEQPSEEKETGTKFVERLLAFLEANHDPLALEHTRTISPLVMKGLAQLGAFGIKIPKKYGGLGFSQVNYNRVIHAVASYCPSIAVLLSAHQSIGVPEPLLLFGSEEQKKKWLPRFSAGQISAFSLTETEVGSDPARMKMTATPIEDGKFWLLNGEKLWTTNGPIADVLVVMALTAPIQLPNGKEKKQITAFIVETNSPGFSVLHRCTFMGLSGIQNGLLSFKNVKVPSENIISEVGQGLKVALTTLNSGRLTLPAACLAAGKVSLAIGRTWTKDRVQWGKSIGNHEMCAAKLTFLAGATYLMDAVSNLGAHLYDLKKSDIRIESSISKLLCTGLAWQSVDNLLQLRGGRGYETADSLRERGEDAYPVEKLMRDIRINTIIEGSSEIQRLFIAREALDQHLQIAGGIFDPKKSFWQKTKLLFKAFGFYLWWYPKQWLYLPFLNHWGIASGWETRHLQYISSMSHKLSRKIFHAMVVYGPALENRQMILKEIVDSGMYLYGMSAVLSQYLTRKQAGTLQNSEVEITKEICTSLVDHSKSSYRKIKLFPKRSKLLEISHSIMNGDLVWMETDICRILEQSRSKAESKPAAA